MAICKTKSKERDRLVCQQCGKCHWNGCPAREQYCEATD